MFGVTFASSRTARSLLLVLATASAAILITTDHADARRRHHHSSRHHARVERNSYSPPFSSIVVDANSGETLQATNADATRHPASLTKIMTLYLLFEQLESGKLRLDSMLEVSEHASEQAPTKLGLRPGQAIRVEDAIKGIVTRSANDAAVVVAEAIGGSEDNFTKLMTRKARALGMSRTTYVNASGLPDDDQITTARDQSILGRAIQDRFPKYYRYFSTEVFNWRGNAIRNHNHLLGRMEGIDGIKTGYVRASGFNIVTSLRRGNRHLVGVVMGGRSGNARDATMRGLLTAHLDDAATRRTVAAISDRGVAETRVADADEAAPKSVSRPAPEPIKTATVSEPASTPRNILPQPPAPLSSGVIASQLAPIPGSSEPMKPTPVRTVQVRTAQPKTNLAPPKMAAPVATSSVPVRVASAAPDAGLPVSAASSASGSNFPAPLPIVISRPTPGLGTATIGTSANDAPSPASTMAYADPTRGPPPTTLGAQATAMEGSVRAAPPEAAATAEPAKLADAPKTIRNGWIIQVGALDSESEARNRLDAARESAKRYLSDADPFTEPFAKGSKTYYRARFAGLKQSSAEAACKTLKRADISCMAIRN